eukprot:TRINITY_DN5259_c0_g2_i1.p2 TRINITY_DN5259_c0_g2~~TRINITY_DN5259_c0_g2_i1.p2  ORF type:complete len:212 (-),score=70.33 TRINITY_DN5259_c0_g2_i1:690-1325(-)
MSMEWLDSLGKLEKGAKKTRPNEKMSGEDYQRMIKISCKLALQNAQANRALCIVVFLTFILPKDSEIVAGMETATKGYADIAKNNKKHQMGPPHWTAWAALLRGLIDFFTGEGKGLAAGMEAQLTILQSLADKMKAGPSQAKDQVLQCRLSRTYKSTEKRLQITFAANAEELKKATQELLAKVPRSEQKWGQAPPGNLERQLQELLGNDEE